MHLLSFLKNGIMKISPGCSGILRFFAQIQRKTGDHFPENHDVCAPKKLETSFSYSA